MFGLLRPQKRLLATEDWNDYASSYCNLCASLSYRYGVQTRLLVVHDVAAADWLLSGACPSERAFPVNNCLKGGVRSVPQPVYLTQREQFLAAVSAYTIGVKVQDDLDDRGSWKARVAFAFYKSSFARARRDLLANGFDVQQFEDVLAEQKVLERAGETDLQRASGPSGAAFGLVARHLAQCSAPVVAAEDAFGLGDRIGRSVFLVDAYQDFARDATTGNYNPLRQAGATRLAPERGRELQETVRQLLEEAHAFCAGMAGRVAGRWRGARAALAAGVGDGITPEKDRPASAEGDKPVGEEGQIEGPRRRRGKNPEGGGKSGDGTEACCAGYACCEVSCCCLDVAACL